MLHTILTNIISDIRILVGFFFAICEGMIFTNTRNIADIMIVKIITATVFER